MSIVAVEEKIRKLPEAYIVLVNDYVDSLLARAKKVQDLQGAFSRQGDVNLIGEEKTSWKTMAMEKHHHG